MYYLAKNFMFVFHANMEIGNVKNTYSTNFASRRLFATTLCKKLADGRRTPVRAFISELTAQDCSRSDLSISEWQNTTYGKDILKDLKDWYYPKLRDEYTTLIPDVQYGFFAVELPLASGNKALSLGEVKILDDRIVLDRLQSLAKFQDEKLCFDGGGSAILYAVADLANKLKKGLVSLEADKEAVDFYKKAGLRFEPSAGMQFEPREGLLFFRLYQPEYAKFLEKNGKKFGINIVG